MSKDSESIAERLKRASEGAQAASNKEEAPTADPLSFETIKEKAEEQGTIYYDQFSRMAAPAIEWGKKKSGELYEKSGWFKRTYDVADVTWNYGLKQLFWLSSLPTTKIIRPLHKKIFNVAAYSKDAETGERTGYNRFRYTAATLGISVPAVIGAVASFYTVSNAAIQTPVWAGDYIYDGIMITQFGREEEAIVGKPELHTNWYGGEYYKISVCQKPCNKDKATDNTTYKIVPNTFLTVNHFMKEIPEFWNVLYEFKLKTVEEIADEASTAENDCTLKLFGVRNDLWGWEPKVYDMSCSSVRTFAPEASLNLENN